MSTTIELLKASAVAQIQADLTAAVASSAASASASATSAASSAATALNALSVAYKGGVAGASVPATSTAAGDQYRITSAGTSQGKTWAIGDAAIYNGTSGQWTQITGWFAYADNADLAQTAALIERDGLRFDGTAGVTLSSTSGNIGTTDFYMAAVIRAKTGNPATGIIIGSAPNGALLVYNGTANRVEVYKSGSVSADAISTATIELETPAIVIYSRASGVGTFYVNGVAAGSAANTVDYAAGFNRLGILDVAPTLAYFGTIANSKAGNYALSAQDISDLTRRGLVTLPEQRGGSMDFATSITADVGSPTSVTRTTVTFTGGASQRVKIQDFNYAGQQITFSGTISGHSAGSFTVYLSGGTPVTYATGNGAFSVTLIGGTKGINSVYFQNGSGAAVITGIVFKVNGTLFEQDSGQRNAGYMVRDSSGNGRHLELPATGVSINDPSDTGFIEYTRTTDGYLIGDRRVIPSTGYLVEVVATGDGTVTLGESAGTPANVVASVTLTSTPKILTLLVTQTSNGKLYADLGTATTATFKIRHRAV